MSAKELVVVRDPDRVHYLTSECAWGTQHHVAFKSDANFGVMRFTDRLLDEGRPVLKLESGAFTFFHSLTIDQARLLALALNVAADEAEAEVAAEARMACVAAGA